MGCCGTWRAADGWWGCVRLVLLDGRCGDDPGEIAGVAVCWGWVGGLWFVLGGSAMPGGRDPLCDIHIP